MFRIYKFGNHLIQTKGISKIIQINSPRARHELLRTLRFYSRNKNDDSCPKCPPEKPSKPIEPELPECRPKTTLSPCEATPVDCNYGRKPLPLYKECAPSNRMDDLPPLQCPYEVHDNRTKKKYLIVLILGTLMLLASCATLYIVQKPPMKPPKDKKYKRPKIIKKVPGDARDLPVSVPYLLIGGGTASFSAFRAIKSAQPEAKVLVISKEEDFPYMRPPLSKELWFSNDPEAVKNLTFKQWNGSERSLFYEPKDFYVATAKLNEMENGGVAIARGWSVCRIDVVEKIAYLDNGSTISYDKCLIATGATPKNLDLFIKAEQSIRDKVTLYREIFDFQELNQIMESAEAVAIIGGGFLGSELACSLAKKGGAKTTVYQIFKEGGNMGKILPEYLSTWTTEKIKCEGVEIIPYAEVTGVHMKDEKLVLNLSNEESLAVDHVIVSIGVVPNTDLAENSRLEVDPDLGGYLVNTELQARSNLYIAGDCSCFYDTKLGRRRVEHHDHAVVSGRLAGENMTGSSKPYWHQSMFWSDLGPDVGYEAIGIVDSSLPTVGVFTKASTGACTEKPIKTQGAIEEIPRDCEKYIQQDPEQKKMREKVRREESQAGPGEDYSKGVIFYLRDDIVVGIVLWNLFNRMNIARQVLKEEKKYDDLNEVAKLFNIHEE